MKHVTGQKLALAKNRIHRTVQIQILDGLASNALQLPEPQQRLLGSDVQQMIQFFHEMAGRRILDRAWAVSSRVPWRENQTDRQDHRPLSSGNARFHREFPASVRAAK